MLLATIPFDHEVTITAINVAEPSYTRLIDIGIDVGSKVRLLTAAPLGDPLVCAYGQVRIALAKKLLTQIEVVDADRLRR